MRQVIGLLQTAAVTLRSVKGHYQEYRGSTPADTQIPQWRTDVALADLALISGKKAEAVSIFRRILEQYPDLDVICKRLAQLEGHWK